MTKDRTERRSTKGIRESDCRMRLRSTPTKLLAAEEKHLSGFFLRVISFHERWLRRALERPLLLVMFSAGLIVVSIVCFMLTDTDLLPEMDEGGFVIDYIMPAGSSLAETNRVIAHVEQMLQRSSRSRKHVAAHRLATRSGRSDGSQYAATSWSS